MLYPYQSTRRFIPDDCRRCAALLALAFASCAASATVTVDGRIDTEEWRGARHITDFRKVEPFNGEPARLPVEAWVLSTPEGLAIAFRVIEPEAMRTRQRKRRDENASVDRINVVLDFNGNGRTAYNFTVTNANDVSDSAMSAGMQFNGDWDGVWGHAVQEDAEGWSVEVLIPWYTAPMPKADNGMHTVGLYLDRAFGSTGERVAWPQTTTFGHPRFLLDLNRVELPAYRQSLLAVTPHVLGSFDNVGHRGELSGGADLRWKPSGQTQLTATLNPDFGQVESDDLVVNFSAQETFFSDKRPFFTENHGLYDFNLLLDDSQLIYTRRVGGPADDGRGVSEIDGAVKLNGVLGATEYGVLAAQERSDAGRTFAALRLNHDFGTQAIGMLATRVKHPWLDREASVLGVDYRWQPNERVVVTSNVVGSDIDQPGLATQGVGAVMNVSYQVNNLWSHEWYAMHFDNRLDINDFGYLPRADLNYLHWEVRRRFVDMPETSAYRAREVQVRGSAETNSHGLDLRRSVRVEVQGDLRNGGKESIEMALSPPGHDDLITRGHGVMRSAFDPYLSWERSRPRQGNWAWSGEASISGNRLSGIRDGWDWSLQVQPTYFFSDALSTFAEVTYTATPALVVWQYDNLIASFRSKSLQLAAGLAWNIGDRQTLLVRLQALGLDANSPRPYRVNPDMRALASADPVDEFSIRNLGLQVRYRYELAPLSDLYVVYGRGGYAVAPIAESASEQFLDSFRLRDSEQLLVKFAYRFSL